MKNELFEACELLLNEVKTLHAYNLIHPLSNERRNMLSAAMLACEKALMKTDVYNEPCPYCGHVTGLIHGNNGYVYCECCKSSFTTIEPDVKRDSKWWYEKSDLILSVHRPKPNDDAKD